MDCIKNNTLIGIWGFGKMGISAANYFNNKGCQISIMDKRTPTQKEYNYLKKNNIQWYTQDQEECFFNSCDIIIPSPGINIMTMHYATRKEKFLSELDFFYNNFHKPIIAITGSIGKTSITHILSQLFKELSLPVAVGGNIGIPTFDLIEQQNYVDYALLEVSSFQLMRCTKFAPTLAVWTNFYSNHLDYHAIEDEYFWAKYNVLKHQKENSISFVPLALRNKIPAPSTDHTRAYFSVQVPLKAEFDCLQNNESLYFIQNNAIMHYIHNKTSFLLNITEQLSHLSFIDNILILVSACHLMGIEYHAVETIGTKTELPAHRLEKIDSANNITFYNDSKGTTTVSTLAAVEKLKYRPLHLFIGGLSKGIDRAPFVAQLKHAVKHVYCFGKEAQELYAMCIENEIPATSHTLLNCAVDTCITKIESGDCVLLSPAGSSFDLYENYEQRGNHFKELIKKYIKS
jgi:UDP-N-acetylmuramoylalanine--D-glutamate ligase